MHQWSMSLVCRQNFFSRHFEKLLDAEKPSLQSMKEDYEKRMKAIEKSIIPLLVNLAKNPEREYILWPNRKDKIEKQIDKIIGLTRTYT